MMHNICSPVLCVHVCMAPQHTIVCVSLYISYISVSAYITVYTYNNAVRCWRLVRGQRDRKPTYTSLVALFPWVWTMDGAREIICRQSDPSVLRLAGSLRDMMSTNRPIIGAYNL